MANVGTAYVSVVPSMKGAASAITKQLGGVNVSGVGNKIGGQLTDGISKGTSALSGKMAALGGTIAGVASSITSSLVDAVASLGGEMVSAADGAQKFASTLSFAKIDTSTIEKLTASTQEYADRTVYDLNDIRNATAQLAANGVNDYAQLAEAAGNLNAVAGGNAETFKSVGMVMTQTAGSGKLMTENWNQLTDAIPGASGALQDAMRSAGAFEGNFREAMEKGEISADEFFAAVQKLGMQDVAVQAATSTSTIEGALGNLQAAVVKVGSTLVTKMTPAVTDAMSILADKLSGVPSMIEGAFSSASTTLAPVLDAARSAADTLSPSLSSLGEAASSVASAAATMVSSLTGISSPADAAAAAANGITSAANTLKPVLDGIASALTLLGPNLDTVVMGMTGLFAAVSAGKGLQSLVTGFQEAKLAVTLLSMEMKGASIAEAALNGTMTASQTIVALLTGKLTLGQLATQAMTVAQKGLNAAMKANPIAIVVTLIGTLVTALITLYMTNEDFRNAVNAAWSAISAKASEVFGMLVTFFTQTVPQAISDMQAWFAALPGNIGSALSSALASVASWASSMASKAMEAGQKFFDTIRNKFNEAVSFVKGIPGKIISALGNLGSLLYSAGSDLIAGLKNGIMGAIDGVVSAVRGGVDRVISAAKGLLGIASPSKVFAEIGDYTMQGFAEGIEKSRGLATDAMRSAMGDVYGVGSNGARSMRYANAGYGSAHTTNNIYIDGASLNGTPQLMEAFEAFMGALTRTYGMGVA